MEIAAVPAWTKEEDEQLKELYGRGDLSISQISKRLQDRNRNQVIGRLHRLGIAGNPLMPLVARIAKDFPEASQIELLEALAAEPDEIKKGLSYASIKRALGSYDEYRPEIVARMRAHLRESAQ